MAGKLIGNGVGAFIGGFLLHAPMDMLPHHDYGSPYWSIMDFFASLFLFWGYMSFARQQYILLLGGLGCALPDFELIISTLFYKGKFNNLYPTHNGVLPHGGRSEFFTGFWLQLFLIALSFYILVAV